MSAKPWMMLVAMMAGWINRQQQEAIEYLKEENKILHDKLLKATGNQQSAERTWYLVLYGVWQRI